MKNLSEMRISREILRVFAKTMSFSSFYINFNWNKKQNLKPSSICFVNKNTGDEIIELCFDTYRHTIMKLF